MITIDEIETLAEQLEESTAAQKQKRQRLLKAFARILAVREPQLFERQATELSDEEGHCDNSYPPEITRKAFTGPRLRAIISEETEDVPTDEGFYHGWRRVTSDLGLYVARDGSLYGAEQEGSGRFSQFAAYPGDRGVMVQITYRRLDLDEVPLDRLVKAERELRALAFPRAAKLTAEA